MKRTALLTLGIVILIAIFACGVLAETIFFDDFEDGIIGDAFIFSGEDLPQTSLGTPEWIEENGVFSQVSTAQGDEAHAVIVLEGLEGDETIQAKVRLDSWVSGDSARAGLVLGVGEDTGRGMNFLIHNTQSTIQFLNDQDSWGATGVFDFETEIWYVMQFQIDDGILQGKIWLDGEQEPDEWMLEQAHFGVAREGYPAINGGTSPHGGSVTVSYDDVWIWDAGGPTSTNVHTSRKLSSTWGEIKK